MKVLAGARVRSLYPVQFKPCTIMHTAILSIPFRLQYPLLNIIMSIPYRLYCIE
jgi:hypothetical protein